MGSRPDSGLTCQVEKMHGDASVVKHDVLARFLVKLWHIVAAARGSYELSPETPAGRERCSESERPVELPPLPSGKCLRNAGCLSD